MKGMRATIVALQMRETQHRKCYNERNLITNGMMSRMSIGLQAPHSVTNEALDNNARIFKNTNAHFRDWQPHHTNTYNTSMFKTQGAKTFQTKESLEKEDKKWQEPMQKRLRAKASKRADIGRTGKHQKMTQNQTSGRELNEKFTYTQSCNRYTCLL